MHDDHRRVLDELDRLERAAAAADAAGADAAEVRALVTRMREHFDTHMAAEDEVLFPALARALPGTRASLEPLQDDHRELRAMLTDLAHLLDAPAEHARDEQIAVLARDFADLLRIHIRKEEAIAFRIAEPVLHADELERLAERWTSVPTRRASREGTPPSGKELLP
jgi:hemerythrin-like domain-containing protein